MLNTEGVIALPPNRNLVPRLHDQPFLVETRINLTKIVLTFPRSVLLTMIILNHHGYGVKSPQSQHGETLNALGLSS